MADSVQAGRDRAGAGSNAGRGGHVAIVRWKLAGLLCSLTLWAGQGVRAEIVIGECAEFREGGEGRILKMPTYWLRGQVVDLRSELRRLERCPVVDKSRALLSQDAFIRLMQAMPCAHGESDVREIEWGLAELRVDVWESPWSRSHGAVGLLFRGAFMGQTLVRGQSLIINTDWLVSSEQR